MTWRRSFGVCVNLLELSIVQGGLILKKLLLVSLLLTGCMSVGSGLKPEIAYSGYDNAKTVEISPHGSVCESMGCNVISVGAQWSEAKPEDAFLVLSTYSYYQNMTGLRVKVNGEEYALGSTGLTDHTHVGGVKESTQAFPVPYALIKKMSNADSVWMRVDTPTGYVDYAIKTGDSDSKAYHALKRFVTAVGH